MGRTILDAPVRDIEKRRMPSKHYVYVIHVNWSDGSITIIYRRYSKFFDFHVKLLSTFPDEGGVKIPSHRTIPFLPGKKVFGRSQTREVALKRMNQLDDYCKYLVKLPAKISNSEDVIAFFSPTPEDINPPTSPDTKISSSSPSSAIDEISDPIQAEQYKVIADYKKQQKNEVDLEADDIVEVFEKNENGWWFVSVQDSQGWAPGTFLARVDGGDDDDEESISGNDEKYITNNKYVGQLDDELSVETGVVVKVVKKSLDGWWQVKYQDKLGWVPATYLQPYTGPDLVHSHPVEVIGNVMSISNLTLTSSPNPSRKNKFKPGQPGRGINKRFNTEAKPTPPRRSTVRKTATGGIKHRKRSQYETTTAFKGHSGSKECIKFDASQRVEVLHKNEEWWFIKIGSQEGWAPASHIAVIDDSIKEDEQPPPPPPPSYPMGAAIDPHRSGSSISVDSETGAPRGEESPKFKGKPRSTSALYSSPGGNLSGLPKRPPAPPKEKPNYVSIVTEEAVAMRPPAPLPAKSRPTTDIPTDNHISEALKKLRPVSVPAQAPLPPTATTASRSDDKERSIAEIRAKLDKAIGNHPSTAGNPRRGQLYRTVAPFSDDEGISFRQGVEVELIEKDESGWWNVRIGTEEGWAPSNFLEPID